MPTPLKSARRLGSARSGTETFLLQRVTAVANLLLIPFLVWIAVVAGNAGYDAAKALLARPFVSLPLLLLIVSVGLHMRIGMKEIIEDYVHSEGLKALLLILNTFFVAALAAASAFAVLKLSFGG